MFPASSLPTASIASGMLFLTNINLTQSSSSFRNLMYSAIGGTTHLHASPAHACGSCDAAAPDAGRLLLGLLAFPHSDYCTYERRGKRSTCVRSWLEDLCIMLCLLLRA